VAARALAVDAGVQLAEVEVEVIEVRAQLQGRVEVLDRPLVLGAGELFLVEQAEGHVRLVVEPVHADADRQLLYGLLEPAIPGVDDAERVVGLGEPRRVGDRGRERALGGRLIAGAHRLGRLHVRGLGGLARSTALLLLQLVERDLQLEVVDVFLGLLGQRRAGRAADQLAVDLDR
jgi:hypothetical protein